MLRRSTHILLATFAVVLFMPGGPLAPAQTVGGTVPVAAHTYAPLPDYVIRHSPVVTHRRPSPRQVLVQETSYQYVPPAKRTALIVGINHARGAPPLPGSLKDAANLNEALLRYGFRPENITVLRESAATRPAILGALRSLARRTPTTGVAVFGIATHTSRRHGTNFLRTAEGAQISAPELAARLREVHAPMWVAMPTCYAGGYALPGIVGFNRVATFATSAYQPAYQLGKAGSFLFIHMVRRAMIEGRATSSVEAAFEFARAEIQRRYPENEPTMSDGYPGDLILGPVGAMTSRAENARTPSSESQWSADPPPSNPNNAYSYDSRSTDESASSESPSPTPSPGHSSRPGRVCGRFAYNCSS